MNEWKCFQTKNEPRLLTHETKYKSFKILLLFIITKHYETCKTPMYDQSKKTKGSPRHTYLQLLLNLREWNRLFDFQIIIGVSAAATTQQPIRRVKVSGYYVDMRITQLAAEIFVTGRASAKEDSIRFGTDLDQDQDLDYWWTGTKFCGMTELRPRTNQISIQDWSGHRSNVSTFPALWDTAFLQLVTNSLKNWYRQNA